MPVDLKKFERIFLIHQKLRTKRHFSDQDLMKACADKLDVEISKRTLEYDIFALKEQFGAPVKKRKGVYFYEDEPYSIFKVFEDSNYGTFQELISLLRQQNAKEWPELEDVLLKLEQKIGVLRNEPAINIFFEQQPLKGIEKLEGLFKAIRDKTVLNLTYKPFSAESEKVIASPLALKQFNGRWFLIGFDHHNKYIRLFALDRIEKINWTTAEKFEQVTGFDAETYFKDVIGVTVLKDVDLIEIKFRVKKNRAFYVETKPLHPSQEPISETDRHMVFMIKVKPNQEMWAKFFELAEDLEILEPLAIRNQMAERLSKSLGFYQ